MIYLDHHSTTPLDPAALAAMLPLFNEQFANAGSVTHAAGRQVAELVEQAIAQVAQALGASAEEMVVTSGATESNNLAIFGTCLHPRQRRRKVVSLVTEHKAVLDPLARLAQQGFEIQQLPVQFNDSPAAGAVDLQRLSEAIDEHTALVTVMLANNEIGVLQPLEQIASMCRRVDCLLHTDATQAVGRIVVNVDALDVDLLSFSAHKFYGPKGVGGLFVRRRGRRVKLQSQIVGGGQQHNFRSGTLNSAGIVGMQAALAACLATLAIDQSRIASLRNRLFELLTGELEAVCLNGPPLDNGLLHDGLLHDGSLHDGSLARGPDDSNPASGSAPPAAVPALRLAGNLNCSFYPIEGQSLMLAAPELAVSSGSACTSANPSPSHVLQALGLSEERARSSLRFGIGRFTTRAEIEQAAAWLVDGVRQLRQLI
ncbi:MAG: cysteine desulfurase [Planctomycetales bacterium]|nr:cysteine desulfurase [Planctomycetales bacterium]